MSNRTVYGLRWPDTVSDLEIEIAMVRSGGYMVRPGTAVRCGEGLFFHFRRLESLLWPGDDHHRWSDLCLSTMLDERITVLMGARDSSKTYTASKFTLTDYFCFPEETLSLMSSTATQGLELRVWGTVKGLFEQAKELHPYLPGKVVHSKFGIFTDVLEADGDVRDMRKGIICVACEESAKSEMAGLERFVGIKQKRRRLVGDELQFMPINYLKAINVMDKGEFKGVFCQNPIGGNGKAGDKIAEPLNGWSSQPAVTKTATWRNKYGGVTVNLVGTDSPNFDADRPKDYPYLIDQGDVDRVKTRSGETSAEYVMQILGVRKIGVDTYKVLTEAMCKRFGAFAKAVWEGRPRTKVYGVDAGFGGDPCVGQYIEFGPDVRLADIVKFYPPDTIPIDVDSEKSAEDQIAEWLREHCSSIGIADENVFVECGMRATLAVSMGRIMSPRINAVNFGGAATDRPVSNDLFVFDEATQQRRLKKCSEHYSKLVTEFWFTVRALVECGQAREFPESVLAEFEAREWRWVSGNRYELETKKEMKERVGYSPNQADAASVAIEGARRLGFQIQRFVEVHERGTENDWLTKELAKYRKQMKKRELQYR